MNSILSRRVVMIKIDIKTALLHLFEFLFILLWNLSNIDDKSTEIEKYPRDTICYANCSLSNSEFEEYPTNTRSLEWTELISINRKLAYH